MQRWMRVAIALGTGVALWLSNGTASLAGPGADKINVETELSTKNVRTEESNLADVITDALRATDRSDGALMHASAFAETTVPKGSATTDDILKAVPYKEDTVVIVNLTGAQLKKALENGLKLYPQKSPEFLQVSGITANIDPSADKEKRVTSVRVGGSSVDDKKTYKIAMPSPLANGALGYYKIWDKATAIDHDTNKSVAQSVTDYLSSNKTLSGKGDDRLVFKK
jgi:5'-nucleotidase/UDP-sugar diphosphatase